MYLFKKYLVQRKVKKSFAKKLGYPLSLKNPKTYCEKIQWLKFNSQEFDQKVIERTDKNTVRSFVEKNGFGNTLVTQLGFWKQPEEIEWDRLPEKFVLKLNNGSGKKCRWFVKNKFQFPRDNFSVDARREMFKFPEKCRNQGQFHYSNISPGILAEELLEESDGGLKDYKFYCFHGKVAFVSVESGKVEGIPLRQYFDGGWNKSPVKFFNDFPEPEKPFRKPENFDAMLHMAEILSQGYPHLRVDLYNIAGKIYFGELTYTPENGMTRWNPPSLDYEFGALMDIHAITH